MGGFIGDILGGILGGSAGGSNTQIQYMPQQIADIEKTNQFRSGTMMPYYSDYLSKLQQGYNQALPGINAAAQGGAGYAGQMAQTLGETGESAARTGVSGLESFFSPQYGAEQYQAAMAPIQAQYQQNVANQGAQFGGAGELGSARQALAGQQLAGANQSAQMQAAAQVMNNLNNQRLQAGQALSQTGGNYLQGGLGAQQARYGFATAPTDYLTKTLGQGGSYVNQSLYNAPYPGQQSTQTQQNMGLGDAINTGMGIWGLISALSDSRLKENIKPAGKIEDINVYTYNYKGDKTPRFGVMAQELKNTKYAHAVSIHDSGYYQVNYGMLPEAIRVKAFA
jgi:hypothetical protein